MKRDDPLIDVAGAAEYLNVREGFIRRLVTERRIPVVHIGRLVRFEQSALDVFIAAGRQEGSDWHLEVAPVQLNPRRRRTA